MADLAGPGGPSESTRVMTLYGQAMTRSGAIFTIGIMAILPFGLISLAVTTRYLDPSDFGRLTILFAIASVMTVLSGVGFFQGTMMTVYQVVDGDDGGVAEIDEGPIADVGAAPELDSDERRRVLASGFLIVAGSAALLCGAVAVFGALIAEYAFGSSWGTPVRWMAASAWSGTVWRMAHQVPRMERRPGQWAVLQFVRPAIVVAGTIAALAAGMGINGVLIATTVGTLIATVIAFLAFRRCYIFAFKKEDVGMLWRVGKQWVPLIIAASVQANAAILILAVFASPASVGLFQVASRVAQFPSFFADGFLTGWPAMERSPISFAAKDRKGPRDYSASVFTLFALSTLGLLMATSLLSGALIHIAAPAYASAAGLIPIVAASYGALSVFRGIYRATSFPRRRYWYVLLHFIWIAPLLGISTVLIPIDASYGMAIAQIAAAAIVSLWMALIDRRSPTPTPFQWRRLGFALLVTGVFVIAVNQAPVPVAVHAALALASFVAFPLILIASGTVPRHQVQVVKSIIGSVMPHLSTKRTTRQRLSELPPPEREAVELIACADRTPAEAGNQLGVSPAIALARLVRGLRQLAGSDGATPIDHLVGEYVIHPGTTIERDAWATRLRQLGIDPLQLHLLDETVRTVRRIKAPQVA